MRWVCEIRWSPGVGAVQASRTDRSRNPVQVLVCSGRWGDVEGLPECGALEGAAVGRHRGAGRGNMDEVGEVPLEGVVAVHLGGADLLRWVRDPQDAGVAEQFAPQ